MKNSVRYGIIFFLIFINGACSKDSLQIVNSRSGSSVSGPSTGGGAQLPPPTDLFLFSSKDYFSASGSSSASPSISEVAKNSKDHIFVVGSSGWPYETELRRSTDLGQTWSVIYNKDLDYSSKIFIDDQDHLYLWKTNSTTKVQKSEDGGKVWFDLPLETSLFVGCSSYNLDSFTSQKIGGIQQMALAGYCYNGSSNLWVVIRSVDGGITWFRDDPAGMTTSYVSGAKIINNYLYVYGSTGVNWPYDVGVARKNLSTSFSWESMISSGSQAQVKDLQVSSSSEVYILMQSNQWPYHSKVFKLSSGGSFSDSSDWVNQPTLDSSSNWYSAPGATYFNPEKLLLLGAHIYVTGQVYFNTSSQWFLVRDDGSINSNVNLFGSALAYSYLQKSLLVGSQIFMFGSLVAVASNYPWTTRSVNISNAAADLSDNSNTTLFQIKEDYLKFWSGSALAQINSLQAQPNSKIVFGAGYSIDNSGKKQWMVRRSENSGESWSQDYLSANLQDSEILTSVVFPNGDYYVAGYEINPTTMIKQAMIKKRNSSNLYSNVVFATNSAVKTSIAAMGYHGNDLYLAVSEFNSSRNTYDLKLYRIPSPSTSGVYTLLETYSYNTNKSVFPAALHVDLLSGDVLISASALSSTGYRWVTLKRNVQTGSSLSVVDDYQLNISKEARGNAITKDTAGNIFVAGYAKDEKDLEHMIVRASYDQGSTWNTVDDYTDGSNGGVRAEAILAKDQGDLFIAGTSISISGTANLKAWVVRRLSVFSNTVQVLDSKSGSLGSNWKYIPKSLCFSNDGGLLVGGSADDTNQKVSVVRKGYRQE